MRILAIALVWFAVVAVGGGMLLSYLRRIQARRHLWENTERMEDGGRDVDPLGSNWLSRWLFLAGFRSPQALMIFLISTSGTLLGGLLIMFLLHWSGLLAAAERAVLAVPGGTGKLAQPVLRAAPWIVLVSLIALPTTVVRAARRRRIELVEQDLPITLELLATLAESGIGFDAATERIISSRPPERPLTAELRTFQAEMLAGHSRVECLRCVARRLEVTSVTIFISALVQAEQIGSGVAAVLRQQADDLRQRRRERALELSMSLPIKQIIPLVVCFLPGVMVFALGPLFAEFMKYTSTISTFGGR